MQAISNFMQISGPLVPTWSEVQQLVAIEVETAFGMFAWQSRA